MSTLPPPPTFPGNCEICLKRAIVHAQASGHEVCAACLLCDGPGPAGEGCVNKETLLPVSGEGYFCPACLPPGVEESLPPAPP
jgi:hypothetical protein